MFITAESDVTGSFQPIKGSDNRINVSARQDARAFYISRDKGQSFVLAIQDTGAETGDLIAYLKNNSATKKMFIHDIEVSSLLDCVITIGYADSTTATGPSVTAVNLNRTSSNAAEAVGVGGTAIGGTSLETTFDRGRVKSGDEHVFEFNNSLILGQNDAITVMYTGSTGTVEVEIFFTME